MINYFPRTVPWLFACVIDAVSSIVIRDLTICFGCGCVSQVLFSLFYELVLVGEEYGHDVDHIFLGFSGSSPSIATVSSSEQDPFS